jgi:Uma2 family endonuclease
MPQALATPTLGIEEYVQGELAPDVRHEYVAGAVYALVGASDRHNIISGNLFSALHAHLRGGPCRAFMSDMKVRVGTDECFYYPDIMVACQPETTPVTGGSSPVCSWR